MAAAISLGHLARLHGQLDLAIVMPELKKLAADSGTDGQAQDARDDIRTFLRKE